MARDSHSRMRWWPGALILAVASAALTWIWLLHEPLSRQHRMVPTYITWFVTAIALVAWLVLFSGLARRVRISILAGVVVLTGLGFALLEIKGVDGDVFPVVGWRWSGTAGFDETTTAATAEVLPGPDDYPQFYGPGRRATLAGPAIARDWQARPPRELWRRPVGEGWSSFAVVGDAAVTQEQRGDDEVVVRYDVHSGRQVWLHADHAPFNTVVGGSGPRATPTIWDGRVYTLGATGILQGLDLDTGKELWSTNILADHGGGVPDWGLASSPLIVDGQVVVMLGRGGAGLAAYDAGSGEPLWIEGDDGGTYSSPFLATVAGRRQLLAVNHGTVTAHAPETGELLWRHPWPNPGGERVSVPLPIGDDRLLVSAGYGTGSILLRLEHEGERLAVEQLWSSPRLKSKFGTIVLHDGVVYGFDDGVLVALDPDSGERIWKRGRYGHGQLILVGELLLVQTEHGDVVLVEATPEEHRELARLAALADKTWNPPALSGRLLLVRNNREAACFELPVEP